MEKTFNTNYFKTLNILCFAKILKTILRWNYNDRQ